MARQQFTLAFLIRQVRLLCVMFAALSNRVWLNIHGDLSEQAGDEH